MLILGFILLLQEVDFSVGPISIQPHRLQYMDFLFTYYYESYRMMIKKPNMDTNTWNTFTEPFSTGVWMSVIVSVLVMPAIFVFFEILSRKFEKISVSHYYCTFWSIIRAFLKQGKHIKLRWTNAYLIEHHLWSYQNLSILSWPVTLGKFTRTCQ